MTSAERSKKWRGKNSGEHRQKNREWYYRNRERALATSRRWKNQNRERVKAARRLKDYGLTPEKYAELFARQQGLCAICKRASVQAVDHNHSTGEVRGLLCHRCNHAIGLFEERLESFASAIQYLTK